MPSRVADAQAPLRAEYRATPAAARATDHARTTGAHPAERCCVVQATLRSPPPVVTTFRPG